MSVRLSRHSFLSTRSGLLIELSTTC